MKWNRHVSCVVMSLSTGARSAAPEHGPGRLLDQEASGGARGRPRDRGGGSGPRGHRGLSMDTPFRPFLMWTLFCLLDKTCCETPGQKN